MTLRWIVASRLFIFVLVFPILNACSIPISDKIPTVSASTCMLINSDVAADDLRAIAILSASRQVRAVVTTGGSTRSGVGAAILQQFFKVANRAPPLILIGTDATPALRSADDQTFRDHEEQPFGAGSAPTPILRTADLAGAAASAVSGCADVTLVILGPWTDVLTLLSVPNLHAVFAQGRPDLHPDGSPVNWNCQQDVEACEQSQRRLTGRQVTWIDVSPRSAKYWSLTSQMLDSLPSSGVSGAVRSLSGNDKARIGWRGLWDDLVAIAILRPDLFLSVGTHFEPAVDNDIVAKAWVAAMQQ